MIRTVVVCEAQVPFIRGGAEALELETHLSELGDPFLERVALGLVELDDLGEQQRLARDSPVG